MKKRLLQTYSFLQAFLFLSFLMITFSCQDEMETTYTYRTQVPVIMEANTFRQMNVGPENARVMKATGKIYIYKDFLLINEPGEGIHLIDNSNPSQPKNLNFIKVPGNVDLAINSDILYADSYIDLLAFDISDPYRIELAKRVEDVFPNLYSNEELGTFITYKDTVITTTQRQTSHWFWGGPDRMMYSHAGMAESAAVGNYGQGGSMARFTLMNDHLYTVNDYEMRLFDVSQKDNPAYVTNIDLGWGIETIFPFKNKLFIGSRTGMHIYDATDPAQPEKMSTYQHITSCDPVVANDDHAFVTLRSGNLCQQGADRLEVLDIQNPYEPRLLKSYPMENPHGLGLAQDNLFICEGDFGLKSFKVTDVMTIDDNLMQHLKNMRSIDVIPGPKSLIVIGPDGVCQYDYSQPDQLKLLSCIQNELY